MKTPPSVANDPLRTAFEVVDLFVFSAGLSVFAFRPAPDQSTTKKPIDGEQEPHQSGATSGDKSDDGALLAALEAFNDWQMQKKSKKQ